MDDLKIHQGDWVVVCDGSKAVVLENAGNWMQLSLRTKAVYEQDNQRTSEIGTDAPGRVAGPGGTPRSAVEQADWHDANERAFLNSLLARLDALLGAGKTRALVIVAPPRALGMLRQGYSPALRAAIRAEIDKDYVRLPVPEIEKKLSG